jgi:PP-loop superfamily ATP-utilizing enzyme
MCRRQVEKAIHDHDMIKKTDRVLVAVSGGKDSLAVWDMLVELGYQADGLYISRSELVSTAKSPANTPNVSLLKET